MSEPIEVEIEGLKEFNKALRQMGGDLPKGTRLAFNEAADLIVQKARPRVDRKTGRAGRSVKAASTRKFARVSGGGNRVPYYGWLDFGGRVGRNRAIYRPYKGDGRFIYASYFPLRDSGEFADILEAQLKDLGRRAGLVIENG